MVTFIITFMAVIGCIVFSLAVAVFVHDVLRGIGGYMWVSREEFEELKKKVSALEATSFMLADDEPLKDEYGRYMPHHIYRENSPVHVSVKEVVDMIVAHLGLKLCRQPGKAATREVPDTAKLCQIRKPEENLSVAKSILAAVAAMETPKPTRKKRKRK